MGGQVAESPQSQGCSREEPVQVLVGSETDWAISTQCARY